MTSNEPWQERLRLFGLWWCVMESSEPVGKHAQAESPRPETKEQNSVQEQLRQSKKQVVARAYVMAKIGTEPQSLVPSSVRQASTPFITAYHMSSIHSNQDDMMRVQFRRFPVVDPHQKLYVIISKSSPHDFQLFLCQDALSLSAHR